MSNKVRRVLAIIGLICMAIFSVSLVVVLADRTLLGGAFGYLALASGLLGIALFLVVKFLVKEQGAPAYLPTPDDKEDESEDGESDEQPLPEPIAPDDEQRVSQEDAPENE